MRLFERVWFSGSREWIGALASGAVLEVAIGTGANIPHYQPTCALTGIDLSAAMLERARARAKELDVTADLRVGDAQDLPFADQHFDTVACTFSLCSIPAPATAIAEMFRVLRPGGQLLLADHIGSSFGPLRGAQWLVEQASKRLAGEFFTRRQLPLVEGAGFVVAHSERHKFGTIEWIEALRPRV